MCKNIKCEDKKMACGECLFDFHGDHVKKVLKIDNNIAELNENYL